METSLFGLQTSLASLCGPWLLYSHPLVTLLPSLPFHYQVLTFYSCSFPPHIPPHNLPISLLHVALWLLHLKSQPPISGPTFSYPFSTSCLLLFLVIAITCNTNCLKTNTFHLNFSFWSLCFSSSASFYSKKGGTNIFIAQMPFLLFLPMCLDSSSQSTLSAVLVLLAYVKECPHVFHFIFPGINTYFML